MKKLGQNASNNFEKRLTKQAIKLGKSNWKGGGVSGQGGKLVYVFCHLFEDLQNFNYTWMF